MSTPDPAGPEQYPQQPPPPAYVPYPAPYPPPGAYPPPYGYPYPPPKQTNGMAVAAMVLGIVGVCNPVGILGLIFGMVAKRQIAERGEAGDGFATAGVVLGWIGVAATVFWILYYIFIFAVVGTAVSELDDWPTDDATSWDYGILLTLLGVA